MSGNGSSFALLPVAIMMFLAVTVVGMAGAFVAMASPQTEQEGPPDTEHVEALINEA
jgi:flagellar basal body-associated protein FliL